MTFETHELYKINASSYLTAAKAILEKSLADELIGPCCQNIGTSIELFLKGQLLLLGKCENVRKYGHRFMDIWNLKCMSDVREHAELSAKANVEKIRARSNKPANPRSLKAPKEELDQHLQWLQEGYSNVLDADMGKYALRYPPPPGKTVTVPSPEFLIPVFEHVYDEVW